MHGKNRIGFELVESNQTIQSYNPATGKTREGQFACATAQQIEKTMQKAVASFALYKAIDSSKRADFLDAIADEILNLGDELVNAAMEESALPEGRIVGERGRTMGQLKAFASLLRDGSWLDAKIDTAIPDRQPLPKPDIRKMSVAVGPVVVFTASNFPLAFSTAGGDTASALAAGCPVIVKAHESHLHTNELISDAISKAAEKTGMPDGVFSSLTGSGFELGQTLVKHQDTKSVAFTGSLRGGMALYKMAMDREEPIPVFAEMGSVNPVIMLPNKLENEANELAKTYAGSITLGGGQFCTNPGIIIGLKSDGLDNFCSSLSTEIASIGASSMLNAGIASAYDQGKETFLAAKGVSLLSQSNVNGTINAGLPTVAKVSGADFIANPNLQHEVFGPFSLIVTCENQDELDQLIESLKGQLTVTVIGSEDDFKNYETQIRKAENITGRIIYNGVPTGVEVCASMQHGGPYPAATDSRFTSVGTDAIKRFVRPLSFQNTPQYMLPDELKDNNPKGIWRNVDGQLTNQSL